MLPNRTHGGIRIDRNLGRKPHTWRHTSCCCFFSNESFPTAHMAAYEWIAKRRTGVDFSAAHLAAYKPRDVRGDGGVFSAARMAAYRNYITEIHQSTF